jgi:hypothetical protein
MQEESHAMLPPGELDAPRNGLDKGEPLKVALSAV